MPYEISSISSRPEEAHGVLKKWVELAEGAKGEIERSPANRASGKVNLVLERLPQHLDEAVEAGATISDEEVAKVGALIAWFNAQKKEIEEGK